MITHEQMRKKIDNIFSEDLVDTQVMTLDYITQQEKVTELLGLYERLSYYSKYDAYDKETRERVSELKDDISQLKKELREMK